MLSTIFHIFSFFPWMQSILYKESNRIIPYFISYYYFKDVQFLSRWNVQNIKFLFICL